MPDEAQPVVEATLSVPPERSSSGVVTVVAPVVFTAVSPSAWIAAAPTKTSSFPPLSQTPFGPYV